MTELEARYIFIENFDEYTSSGDMAMTENIFIEILKELNIIDSDNIKNIIYEYEIFFDSEPNEIIQIHGWYPISTDRIRHPEKIQHYIDIGLLRRIQK